MLSIIENIYDVDVKNFYLDKRYLKHERKTIEDHHGEFWDQDIPTEIPNTQVIRKGCSQPIQEMLLNSGPLGKTFKKLKFIWFPLIQHLKFALLS
jgi:hypothetical protein